MLVAAVNPTAVLATLTGHTHVVSSAAFSGDGRHLATIGADYAVRLWDVLDPRQPLLTGVLSNDVRVPLGIEFTPDGSVLYVARGTAGSTGTHRKASRPNPTRPIPSRCGPPAARRTASPHSSSRRPTTNWQPPTGCGRSSPGRSPTRSRCWPTRSRSRATSCTKD
ncbi:WD40 repeat domain-containing protein [Saccharothrix stipae]